MATTTQRLLDRFKAVEEIASDYEAAKRLGITRATISRWRHGGTMDDATALQLAEYLGAEPLEVLAEVRLDRRMSSRERRIWERFRGRVHAAALATLAAGLTFASPHASVTPQTPFKPFDNVYIMRHWALVRRYLANAENLFRRQRFQWLRPLVIE